MAIFFKTRTEKEIQTYQSYLQSIGALSNLFSDSPNPFLYYRVAERIFCDSFGATNVSRSDLSVDAIKNELGIGLKTFTMGNGKTFQKIAEFNADSATFKFMKPRSLINEVARMRNERINLTHRTFEIKESIYHCVVRDAGRFIIFEEPMNLIDVNSIRDIKLKSGKNSISFHDKHHEYSFLLSKNTLFKRFLVQELQSFPVEILGNPLDKIHQFLSVNGQPSKLTTLFDTDLLVSRYSSKSRIIDTIFLPLYGKNKKVGERSGLNQWNARGRERHPNEVYIPIPAMVHKIAPSFFPDRDTSFDLLLPNEKLMIAKVYQDNSKALMSYSNRELGEWILRQVLGLKCGEVLTYEKLLDLRIDSVRLDKTENSTFEINFSAVGAYDNWLEEIDNAE